MSSEDRYENHTDHDHDHWHGGGRRKDEKVYWALSCLLLTLPIILIMLKVCRKISEYSESRRQGQETDSLHSIVTTHRNSNISIYTLPTKQDYMNMAPPRYSMISLNPIPTTYENPPPYSPPIK